MFWKNKFGWLAGQRVRRISDADMVRVGENVTLEARDALVGTEYASIFFFDVSIEFAMPRGYDAGLPRPGVLIHKHINDIPYVLVPDITDNPDQKFWLVNSVCTQNVPGTVDNVYIWVLAIDVDSATATVNLSRSVFPPGQDLQIRAIRKERQSSGEHRLYINEVGVLNPNGVLTSISRSAVVQWIEMGRNRFFVVGSDGISADVMVEGHYIKTVPDGSTANNLLSLPEF